MSRRTNPWPAFVDLFSALLVAAFAGFILMTSGYKKPGTGAAKPVKMPPLEQERKAISKVREEASRILEELEKKLAEGKLQTRVNECGEDACLDLFIHYPRNLAEIPPDQEQQVTALANACNVLRDALEKLQGKRNEIEVIVEGHADQTQARTENLKKAYLFNWGLSSQRAASVLWEFKRCGLKAPRYNISVIGHADSEPVCAERNEECYRLNRRTTLRLRANTQKISERLASEARK